MQGAWVAIVLFVYFGLGVLFGVLYFHVGSPRQVLSIYRSPSDQATVAKWLVAKRSILARVRRQYVRYASAALCVVAWPSLLAFRVDPSVSGNARRRLAAERMQPRHVEIAANMTTVSALVLLVWQSTVSRWYLTFAYVVLLTLLAKFGLYAAPTGEDLPTRLRRANSHPFITFLAIAILDYVCLVFCLAVTLHGSAIRLSFAELYQTAVNIARFRHVLAVWERGRGSVAGFIAAVSSAAFCVMFLNQITKYKRFHRSVEDRLSRATDLAVLGRPGKARSELDKVPEDKWQDIGIAQVEVLVALTEANFEVALERLEQIYAIRAGAGRRLDSAERGRMEECHLLELLNHSILLLSLRPAEQREFIEFCVSRGAGDGFTAYVLYLVLQLATNENAREVCAGLTDSAAISPERGYSLTRSLARVCSMPDAHDLPPDAVAPFLEDESPDLSGGVGVVRRLIFLTLVLVGPAKPSITTGEIERQMASSTAFLKGLDPTTIPVWEHEATALLVSLLEVGTQLFVDSPSIQQRGDDLRAIRTSLEEAASPALTKVGDLQAEISKTLLRYRTD